KEGRAREEGLLYDHREAPADTDMADKDSLYKGLLHVYGDSAEDNGGWVELGRIMQEIWDPATDPQDARQFYLNQVTHASDSWMSRPELMGAADSTVVIPDAERVVLGFDGSKGRTRGKADATALVGMSVDSKHLFTIKVWERSDGILRTGRLIRLRLTLWFVRLFKDLMFLASMRILLAGLARLRSGRLILAAGCVLRLLAMRLFRLGLGVRTRRCLSMLRSCGRRL